MIRKAIDAFNSGDVEQMLALSDDELEWRPMFGAATGGATAYHGHSGFREYWRGTQEIWEFFHFDPEQFVDDGNSIVVIGRGSGRSKGSGIEIDQPFAMVWKVRAGKAAFGQTFTDPDEARVAAGRLAEERGSAALTQNVERLRAFYNAFNASKLIDPEWLTSDVEFKQPDELGGGEGVYHRRDGFARGVQELLDVFEDFRADPEEFFDAGAYVVVYVRLRGHAKVSGVPFDDPYAYVARFRGEQIDLWHAYSDRTEALKAVGLEE
ncbi:MAG TPA: nuclear transport factor 2 family protein [Solirubrobacteraceae bacterium]|nr:nuclear transport factor 2 family protein [Solirubrobacteraceae bacterium]